MTLAGDAAHPMPPRKWSPLGRNEEDRRSDLIIWKYVDRGQGLNHAVCDAANLVDAILSIDRGAESLKVAITAYDEELVKRGAAEVNLSVKNALMVHDWDSVMDSPAMKHGIKKMS